MTRNANAQAPDAGTIKSIQIPPDLATSMAAPVRVTSFEGKGQTGAEIFAGMCQS